MGGGAARRASARSRQQQHGQWRRQWRGHTARTTLQAAGRVERCAAHAPRGRGERGRGQRQGKDLAAG
eukprot:scaffold1007_cov61-Phaeocystis_antarctica.AAC.4